MRIAVIGAGIVGVTTAYELAAEGHEVTVFERRASVASEASFGHGGLLTPGYAASWARPGLPWQPSLAGWSHLPWLWRWWRAGRPAQGVQQRVALLRLARLSQERRTELARRLRLEFQQRQGLLMLLRGDGELAQARSGLKLLADLGVSFELVDATRARAIEPGLNPDMPLRAAVHLPHDGAGNCRLFAHLLKTEAQRLGARFRFDTEVQRVAPGAAPVLAWAGGEQAFDAVVLCGGAESGRLLRPLGLRLPLSGVVGCSLTAPLRQLEAHPDLGPRAAVVDERHRVTITHLGERVRVAGGARLGGAGRRVDAGMLDLLYRVADDWFPGAAVLAKAQHWQGVRPTLPDGAPVLGASGRDGLWLNLGHGASGWGLACGSARLLADQIAGRPAPADLASLGAERLR